MVTAIGLECAGLRDLFVSAETSVTWPWTDARPRVVVDARDDGVESTMHAKCGVVDERATFITSANFTERAQRDNVGLGAVQPSTQPSLPTPRGETERATADSCERRG